MPTRRHVQRSGYMASGPKYSLGKMVALAVDGITPFFMKPMQVIATMLKMQHPSAVCHHDAWRFQR